MAWGYGKWSKNPTHHMAVLSCDAAEAEMANDGFLVVVITQCSAYALHRS